LTVNASVSRKTDALRGDGWSGSLVGVSEKFEHGGSELEANAGIAPAGSSRRNTDQRIHLLNGEGHTKRTQVPRIAFESLPT
jgi:hypothetical protein